MNDVACEVDAGIRLTIIRCTGDLGGRTILARVEAFWDQHPEIVDFDCLVDMTAYTGSVNYDDLRAIADAWDGFSAHRDAGRRCAVVSRDRFAALFMRLVARVFTSRRFALFNTEEAARHWLGAAP